MAGAAAPNVSGSLLFLRPDWRMGPRQCALAPGAEPLRLAVVRAGRFAVVSLGLFYRPIASLVLSCSRRHASGRPRLVRAQSFRTLPGAAWPGRHLLFHPQAPGPPAP